MPNMPPCLINTGVLSAKRGLTRQQQQQQDNQRRIDRLLDSQLEVERLHRLPPRLPFRANPIRFARPTMPRALGDRTIPLAYTNRPRTMQVPNEAASDYLDWSVENYAEMVGQDETLRERFRSQRNYPINDFGQDYEPQ